MKAVLVLLLALLVAVAAADVGTPFLRGRELEGFDEFADMNDQYDDEMYSTDDDGMGDVDNDDDAWDADDDATLEELMGGEEWDGEADDDEATDDEYGDDDESFADDMFVEDEEFDSEELLWDGAEEEQYLDGYEEGA